MYSVVVFIWQLSTYDIHGVYLFIQTELQDAELCNQSWLMSRQILVWVQHQIARYQCRSCFHIFIVFCCCWQQLASSWSQFTVEMHVSSVVIVRAVKLVPTHSKLNLFSYVGCPWRYNLSRSLCYFAETIWRSSAVVFEPSVLQLYLLEWKMGHDYVKFFCAQLDTVSSNSANLQLLSCNRRDVLVVFPKVLFSRRN
jgi:hypothetical protein